MRLSSLLGALVADADAHQTASVRDVRLVRDGPLLGAFAAWRVSGLIVVEKRHIRLFGYERDVGPLFARALVRRLAGRVWFIPWDDVRDVTADLVTVASRSGDWEALEDLPDRRVSTADR